MKRTQQCKRGRGRGRSRKIVKSESETTAHESDGDYTPSSVKYIVAESSPYPFRSRQVDNQSNQHEDKAPVQSQNTLSRQMGDNQGNQDEEDPVQNQNYIVAESSRYAFRTRQMGDNQGNQDEEAPVQDQNHSSPCGEKSNNSNPAWKSSKSLESLSEQGMESEEASKFRPAEFTQNHLLTNGTPGCGEPKRREEGGGGARSFNFTEVASMMNRCSRDVDEDEIESSKLCGLVNVQGYYVKQEVATLFEDIIKTHGDIGRDCEIKCRKSRGLLVEMMCSVYKELEDASLKEIKETEIDVMLSTVDFLRNAKFDVEWLYQRLIEISRIKNLCRDYAVLKKEEVKETELIVEKEKQMDWHKEMLANLEAEVVALRSESVKAKHEKESLMKKGLDLLKKSLVHGLLV